MYQDMQCRARHDVDEKSNLWSAIFEFICALGTYVVVYETS
jgi:hypothetical protein